jgi:hypothetical protein
VTRSAANSGRPAPKPRLVPALVAGLAVFGLAAETAMGM